MKVPSGGGKYIQQIIAFAIIVKYLSQYQPANCHAGASTTGKRCFMRIIIISKYFFQITRYDTMKYDVVKDLLPN